MYGSRCSFTLPPSPLRVFQSTHVKILSSLLKCVYMQTQFKVRVLVVVRAGDEIASN